MKNEVICRLDKAAYFALYGAVLLKVEGEYGFTKYTMEVTPEVFASIKQQPLVNYQKYMEKRIKLKRKAWQVAGIVRVKRSELKKHHIQQRITRP